MNSHTTFRLAHTNCEDLTAPSLSSELTSFPKVCLAKGTNQGVTECKTGMKIFKLSSALKVPQLMVNENMLLMKATLEEYKNF